MVKTPPGIQSIFVGGIWGNSPFGALPKTKCYDKLNPIPGWHRIDFMALNGTQLQVITFTDWNCNAGYTTNRVLTMPLKDGLQNLWIDASY